MYNLRRTDGKGDSGARCDIIEWNTDRNVKSIEHGCPVVGRSVLVGSISARSFSSQDYWLTTEVTKILEEIKNENTWYMRFKTKNSEYEWWTGEYPKDKSLKNSK